MTCAGNCTLCGMARDSRLCTCLTRRRNSDPIHEIYRDAVDFIEDTRYFGNDAKDEALVLIASARQSFYARFTADDTAKMPDTAFLLTRIDRDAKRLVDMANGRLYATRQKLAENPPKRKAKTDDGLSNSERLKLRRANPTSNVA